MNHVKRTVLVLAALLASGFAHAATGPNTVELTGARIHLGDVVPTAPSDLAKLDLGPSPAAGASRLVAQADILKVVPDDRRASIAAPAQVRVVRKMQRLTATELDGLSRNAIQSAGLPRGATLGAIRAPAQAVVPAGYDRVSAVLPHPPRRQGAFDTSLGLDFSQNGEVVAHLTIPMQLVLGPEAMQSDVVRGSTIAVVVRRGFVEVSSTATTTADGDIGDVVQVVISGTGKSLRAKLLTKDRALAVEAP